MKRTLTLLFFVFSTAAFAQSGITQGAKWSYLSNYFTGNEISTYTYYKDTVIDNQDCAVLSDSVNTSFLLVYNLYRSQDVYTYIKNDSMYWYIDSTFRLSCAFNHQVGDTVAYYCTNNSDSSLQKFVVESVGIRTYQNKNRKILIFRIISPEYEQACGTFRRFSALEAVGWLNNGVVVNNTCFIDGVSPLLQCYKDDSININTNSDCFRIMTSVDDIEKENSFLSSNIITDWLKLNISSPTQLSFFDMSGKMIFERNVLQSLNIDMSSYPSGLYILKTGTKKQHKTYKIIKTL